MQGLRSLFAKKSRPEPEYRYDPARETPMIRASICTGERVAGFKDRETGKFHDLMLIRDQKDLDAFKKAYGLDEIDTEY